MSKSTSDENQSWEFDRRGNVKRKRGSFCPRTAAELKDLYIKMWLDINPQKFLTLSYNRNFYYERGFEHVDRFFKHVLQGVYGPRWHKKVFREDEFKVVGFCEYRGGMNVHFHLGVAGYANEMEFLQLNAADIWRKIQPQGDCLVETIEDSLAAAEYSFKSVEGPNCQDRLYTYTFPDQEVVKRKKPRRMTKYEKRAIIWKNAEERALQLHGAVKDTKKKRAKKSRYGSLSNDS